MYVTTAIPTAAQNGRTPVLQLVSNVHLDLPLTNATHAAPMPIATGMASVSVLSSSQGYTVRTLLEPVHHHVSSVKDLESVVSVKITPMTTSTVRARSAGVDQTARPTLTSAMSSAKAASVHLTTSASSARSTRPSTNQARATASKAGHDLPKRTRLTGFTVTELSMG